MIVSKKTTKESPDLHSILDHGHCPRDGKGVAFNVLPHIECRGCKNGYDQAGKSDPSKDSIDPLER